jgi:glycerol-3-phosphate dehydrogenase
VLPDLAVVIADGGDALAHLATLRDQNKLFGSVASDASAWHCVERVDEQHLARMQAVRAAARERACAAGAGPDLADELVIDIDATITIAHSDNENAANTWKNSFGFHPLLA